MAGANKSEKEPRRNSLSGLQTGGRLSPLPLPIKEYGYTAWEELSKREQTEFMEKYSLIPPKPKKDKNKSS